jgi:ParB-like chromosome segregation protein Spo0J
MYEFHRYANLFPLMEGPEFAELVEDIRANGLHEPIMLHEGKILDGRNRYRACEKANIAPRFLQFRDIPPPTIARSAT